MGLRSIGHREAEALRRRYRTDQLDALLPAQPAAYKRRRRRGGPSWPPPMPRR